MKNKIVITAAAMSVLTLLSKLIGFTREMVMAGFYGTSYVTDAFVLANTIPNIVVGSFLIAVATAYMPLLSEKYEISEHEGKKFTDEVISTLMIFFTAAAVLGVIFSGQIIGIFGYTGETAQLATGFLRISFWVVILTASLNIRNYWLQHQGVFLPQIVGGYALSLSVIACILISTKFGVYWLPVGFVMGYSIQLLISVFVARRNGYKWRPTLKVQETVRAVAGLSFMVFFGSAATQINQFVDKYFATSLAEGSVSALNYGSLVVTTIVGLTATIISTVIYPRMTQASARGDYERLGSLLSRGIMLVLVIAVPFTFGIMAFSSETISVIFERGAFDSSSTKMTESAFFYYGLGMAFTGINALIVNGYYALRNMKTSVWCSLFGVMVNVILDMLLVRVMAHSGLALASSIAVAVNTLTLSWFFRRKYPDIKLVQSWRKVGLIVACGAVSVLFAYGLFQLLTWAVIFAWVPVICSLGLSVVVAVGIYLMLLWMFKFEEVQMMLGVIKR